VPSPLVRRHRLAVLLLLGTFTLLCFYGLVRDSPTVDEFAHLPAGLHYWTTGDFTLFALNPPLIKLLCGLPPLLFGPRVDTAAPVEHSGWYPWIYGTAFLEANRPVYDALFLLGRLPVVLLGLGLGLLVHRWARALYGDDAALAALTLYAFSPPVIAHAHLATVDVGAAFFSVLALYAFERWRQAPDPWRLVGAGVALGLAQLAKHTALLLFPILALLVLWDLARRGAAGVHRPVGRQLGGFALIVLVALGVLDLGYLFQGVGTPLGALGLQSRSLGALGHWLPGLPSPLPAPYLLGLDGLQLINEQGEFPAYLFGRWSRQGWALYYPVALLFKSPLPYLLALVSAPFAPLPRDAARAAAERTLWLPLVALLAAFSLLSKVDYGIRYVLPVIPLGCIYVARWVPALSRATATEASGVDRRFQWGRRLRIAQMAALGLLLTCPLSALLAAPDPIGYFNLLAAGRGEHILLDSNLDWGQGLKRLRTYMDRQGIDEIGLAYFGHVDPALYGIRWHFPAPGRPELVAVSINFLHGYPYATYAHGRIVPVPPDAFTWLAEAPRVADLGGGLVVVRVE
jgi:hypothetical protein